MHMHVPANRDHERLVLLAETAQFLLSTDDPVSQVQGLYDRVAAHLGVDTYFTFVTDENGANMHLQRCVGIEPEAMECVRRLAVGDGVCSVVAKTRSQLCIFNTFDAPSGNNGAQPCLRNLGLRAFCCFPLLASGRLLGTLSFASHTRDFFDDDEVAFMGTISHYISLAKERSRLLHGAQQQVKQLAAAQATLSRQARLLELAHDTMILHDLDNRIIFWNRAAEQMYGWAQGEALGRIASDLLQTQFPQNLEATLAHLQLAGTWQGDLVHTTKDGRQIVVASRWALQQEDSGPPAILEINRDITERLHHIREIESLNVRLKDSVRETHHRVKNNLQILAATLDLQLLEAHETLPATEFARFSRHIQTLAAVHDVLTPQSAAEYEDVVSAKRLLTKLLPMLQEVVQSRDFTYEIDDVLLPTRQASSLCLIINELVSNAAKYGYSKVALTYRVAGDSGHLMVTDDGPGFPDGFDAAKHANTGLELVQNLAHWDLQATIAFGATEHRQEGGGLVTVRMPIHFAPSSKPGPPKY